MSSKADTDLRELCAAVVAEEGRGHTPFGLYLINGSDEYAEIGRAVEREVFFDYFGNSPALLAEEYDRYDPSSLFVCVVDHLRNLPAATMRLILPSSVGFKSFHDLEKGWGVTPEVAMERAGIDPSRGPIWDVGTLAVSTEYRGEALAGIVGLGMFQALNVLGAMADAKYAVMIIDLVVADLLQTHFHRPLVAFPGLAPKHYLGSASSLPMYLDGDEYRSRLALIDADLYEMVSMGSGLEAMISSPLNDPEAAAVADQRWFRTA